LLAGLVVLLGLVCSFALLLYYGIAHSFHIPDLASHCRLLLFNRPRHPLLYRWLGLYPLYALSEIAIITTDLAELIGSAIALNMLFPKLQLWQGVLITACDVLVLLALRDPLRGKPVRAFELTHCCFGTCYSPDSLANLD
jgi:metal iron transporter